MTAYANPVGRLAPDTPSQQCVRIIQQRFKTTFHHIPQQLDNRRLMQILTTSHQHRRRSLTRNQLPNHEIAFNIHTSQADHRDRGACGFLLVS